MPSSRKCIFGCRGDGPLFTLPKDDTVRQKWLDFIFGNEPPFKSSIVYVCARHFTEDCFLNKTLFDSGQISRLSLKEGALITIKSEPKPDLYMGRCNGDMKPTSNKNPPAPLKIQGSAYTTCTRSTQLSAGTLRLQHYRSKGVQAAVSTVTRGTSDVCNRAPKRPRLELEEEEDPASQASSYEQEDTTTDMADLIDMKSPSDFEDAKYIVFESALRELFENCPVCKKHCIMQKRRCGTFVAFSQNCPHCFFTRKWQSQPMKGKIPQGDLELSAAVYFNGGSFTNIEKICNTMNLKMHQYDVFRRHSQNYLEPAIYHEWKVNQRKVLEEIKRRGKIAVGGDITIDSPGKFGSYTMMEFEDDKILDIQLVQSTEVGRNVNLQREGLRRSLDLLEAHSVEVDHIVADRHPEVQRYLQERQMPHCYNVQQVVKGLSRKLEALAKKKDCGVVKQWLPSIKKHMYWTACSSKTASERVVKWTSLVNHIQNTHSPDDPLLPKCLPSIGVSTDGNESFKPGTTAFNKVEKILLNQRMFEDVSKLSSNLQTSSLGSFHSLMKRFASKNTHLSFTEKLCRLYLAAMHHNENTARRKPSWKLQSSKRRTTVGSVQRDTTYGYRSDLMQLVLTEIFDDPTEFQKELQKEPVPPPFTSLCDTPSPFPTHDDVSPPLTSHNDTPSPFSSHSDMSPPFSSHDETPLKEDIIEVQI